jgi:hypothetical protein
MDLPVELASCDERLLRDLLQHGPAHPRTQDHDEAEDIWYYLMTYSFVEPKTYMERIAMPQQNGNGRNSRQQNSHTISSSGRELLKYLNERLSQRN